MYIILKKLTKGIFDTLTQLFIPIPSGGGSAAGSSGGNNRDRPSQLRATSNLLSKDTTYSLLSPARVDLNKSCKSSNLISPENKYL